MESNQLHNKYNKKREYIKFMDRENNSTFNNNKTEYTDNRASRIGNLIKRSLSNNELNYEELWENSEAFFDLVN
jgi:hypothetical protein